MPSRESITQRLPNDPAAERPHPRRASAEFNQARVLADIAKEIEAMLEAVPDR